VDQWKTAVAHGLFLFVTRDQPHFPITRLAIAEPGQTPFARSRESNPIVSERAWKKPILSSSIGLTPLRLQNDS
jgi:hypothetical protein